MAVEQQLVTGIEIVTLRSGGASRAGQRLTISNRTVTKLSFPLKKNNSPTGNVTFTIRQIDDSVLATKVLGDASALSATLNWEEVTFDTPVYINEEVRILAEYSGGGATNNVACYAAITDVKADEYWTNYATSSWQPQATYDAAYIYTFTEGGSAAPVVTTQACTNVIARTATGNGNLQSLGTSAVTQHGHVWNTTQNPTISGGANFGFVKEKGATANLGPFSSDMTDLIPGQQYYVRAFATNTTGTSYGANVQIAGNVTTIGGRYWWVEGKEFHYIDQWGSERKIEGVPDASGLPWYYYL